MKENRTVTNPRFHTVAYSINKVLENGGKSWVAIKAKSTFT